MVRLHRSVLKFIRSPAADDAVQLLGAAAALGVLIIGGAL